MPAHLVAPYPATNSTVRTRGLHWAARFDVDVTIHAPGYPPSRVAGGEPVLLLRNARRLSRGRAEARLLERASPGVYDLDDGLPWDDGNLPGLGHWTKRPFPRSLIARRAARSADRVIVGNEILAEWADAHSRDVRVIPTCVEPSEYCVRSAWSIGPEPLLGWIGSPATEHYLTDVAPALGEVHRRTGARLVVISAPGGVSEALAAFTTRMVWTPASIRSIAQWDLGLMPLRDGVYERAKCGYKLLQYAASGVPAVGSPVGVNRRLLAEMDGFAPESIDDWVDAVCAALSESAERRAQRALAGLEVARAYSYDAWHDAFGAAAGWVR